MGGKVDGVAREQLHEGRRLRTMGGGGGGSPIRPRWAGAEIIMVGGPVEKMSFFQIAPMTKVSTQIHSSMCQYGVYKVSSKKNEWKGSVRGVKVNFFFRGGVGWAQL